MRFDGVSGDRSSSRTAGQHQARHREAEREGEQEIRRTTHGGASIPDDGDGPCRPPPREAARHHDRVLPVNSDITHVTAKTMTMSRSMTAIM